MNKVLLRIRLDKETERQCSKCTKTEGCTVKENMKSMNMLINSNRESILMLQTTIKYKSLLEGACVLYDPKTKGTI